MVNLSKRVMITALMMEDLLKEYWWAEVPLNGKYKVLIIFTEIYGVLITTINFNLIERN